MSEEESQTLEEATILNSNPENPQVKVLVVGSTGHLGKYLLKALHDRNYFVKALVRDEKSLGPYRSFVDEVFVGDVTNDSTLQGLCNDVAVVISVLGVRRGIRKTSELLLRCMSLIHKRFGK
jgi:nucleoside-diphosphate-sugar epimerase